MASKSFQLTFHSAYGITPVVQVAAVLKHLVETAGDGAAERIVLIVLYTRHVGRLLGYGTLVTTVIVRSTGSVESETTFTKRCVKTSDGNAIQELVVMLMRTAALSSSRTDRNVPVNDVDAVKVSVVPVNADGSRMAP